MDSSPHFAGALGMLGAICPLQGVEQCPWLHPQDSRITCGPNCDTPRGLPTMPMTPGVGLLSSQDSCLGTFYPKWAFCCSYEHQSRAPVPWNFACTRDGGWVPIRSKSHPPSENISPSFPVTGAGHPSPKKTIAPSLPPIRAFSQPPG